MLKESITDGLCRVLKKGSILSIHHTVDMNNIVLPVFMILI